jgi:exoribonuclease-2
MNQGKIIEYIDQGRVVCTLCLQDKGNRLHLLTPQNREINIPPKRALLVSESSIDSLVPRENLLNRLKQTEESRERLKEKIQVKELWELIRDEKESFHYEYLAQLCFGEMITDEHVSAMVRALFEDKLYFRMKDGRFLPNSEARVEQIISQKEEEVVREEYLRLGSAFLKEALQNKIVHSFPHKEEIIDLLIELALYGKEAPNHKYGKELFLRAGISDIQQARKILIKLGVWEEDEILDLLRFDIRTSFNENQLGESEQLIKVEIESEGFEDLRSLPCFTIDGPLTKDFDDALSIENDGDYIRLGIHIADVAGVITPDSILDKEASQRGSSLYLPLRQIPMIPLNLSHDTLSLKQGCDRTAISLLARFDKEGHLFDYRFVPSLIRVRRRLTYDQVNELFLDESQLEQMRRLTERMRQKRIGQGALILSLPDLLVKVDSDSSISLEMMSQETPSRIIVAECMILYNWLASRFCRDNNIPILYRGQQAPSERLSIDEAGYIFFVFKQRRKLNPLIIDTEPRPHSGLGLDVYATLSSPIRRYFDLVNQRQIKSSLLEGAPVYNRGALEKIRISVEPTLRDLGRINRNRIRYWIQKYLMQHIGERFSAIILDTMKNRFRIFLPDFLFVAEIKRENGHNFSPGKSIMVRIKESDPWNDLLSIEYAGQPVN